MGVAGTSLRSNHYGRSGFCPHMTGLEGEVVWFAVYVERNGMTYWDNNEGWNYELISNDLEWNPDDSDM